MNESENQQFHREQMEHLARAINGDEIVYLENYQGDMPSFPYKTSGRGPLFILGVLLLALVAGNVGQAVVAQKRDREMSARIESINSSLEKNRSELISELYRIRTIPKLSNDTGDRVHVQPPSKE